MSISAEELFGSFCYCDSRRALAIDLSKELFCLQIQHSFVDFKKEAIEKLEDQGNQEVAAEILPVKVAQTNFDYLYYIYIVYFVV